ncbi:LacI family DNA-binding transcriptional regulator [Marinomonas sp. IMCC 4694]|uniref:LacI family DNA-binding transcriptional regulator n=1 Tax=Marinomonas sp. IMCC 4694 TaxID=2605432 RepID=UPI0011E681CC|nr:LacI family DNA-binding transcriptional regulator [Marinomonas sp. IMCC 4694]TYL46977.1 LacI family transcriptional regulator [Marinomonas sp. IMCC 4694]
MRKPSIREVAKLAEVSTATVSNVFSGKKPVNDELKARVQLAADQLGYQMDRAASQLRSQRNKVVTVLVPNITDTFFATIVSQLENLAFEHGYDVIVASSHDREEVEASRIKALMSWRPAGMIAIPCAGQLSGALLNLKNLCPTVLIDRVSVHSAPFDTVTIDNSAAGELACQHLIDAGHTNILIAASDLSFPPIRERVEGALNVLRNANIVQPSVIELGCELEAGAETITHWLASHPKPSAIFALTNVTTLSTLTALAELNTKVGEDISLVAFDDYAWMSARSTSLTAIRQPVEAVAANAWSKLLERIDSERKNSDPQATVLNASLIKRHSVKSII